MMAQAHNEYHHTSQEQAQAEQNTYQKPKTSLFLKNATDIQGGATNILESQSSGYLTS